MKILKTLRPRPSRSAPQYVEYSPDIPLRDLPLVMRSIAILRWGKERAMSRQGRRALSRRFVLKLARPFSPVVAVDTEGIRYFISTSDKAIGASTFSEGSFDQQLMVQALDLLEELTGEPPLRDGTFIDIGANIGTATIPALTRFGAKRAIAIEPAPDTFKLLRCNIITNELESKVTALNIGLSNREGRALLELCPSNWGDHRVRAGTVAENGHYDEARLDVREIRVRRFDDVADEVDFDSRDGGVVWIDTQGHEGHVLTGAKLILDSNLPVIVEYWPYGLRRAGGLSVLHELIAAHYVRVVDLRASLKAGRTISLSARDVGSLENCYTGTSYTDLILLK